MGEIADQMIGGSMCSQCGVYLEPGEKVHETDGLGNITGSMKMPRDGSPAGIPVLCSGCAYDYDRPKKKHRKKKRK